jgi:hypothetical protein
MISRKLSRAAVGNGEGMMLFRFPKMRCPPHEAGQQVLSLFVNVML